MNRKRARSFGGDEEVEEGGGHGDEIGLTSLTEETEVLATFHSSIKNETSKESIRVDKFERINDLEFESYEVALAYLKANRMGYV